MAITNLTTPGVYVQEISTLPASVVPVATAIPAFVGYTEKGPKNVPTRITSLQDYEPIFGGAFKESYDVQINLDSSVEITAATDSPYLLYYHLQMYFANGGGPCYIISVNAYNYSSPAIVNTDFFVAGDNTIGIGTAEQVDEVTLLIAPEVAELSSYTDMQAIYNGMLAQCNKLKDRFSIFDVNTTSAHNVANDASDFRDYQIGANFLNYGAAYYPPLDTILKRRYSDDDVIITDLRSPDVYNDNPNNRLSTISGGVGTFITVKINVGTQPAAGDKINITVGGTTVSFTAGTDFPTLAAGDDAITAALITAINNHPVLSLVARAQVRANSDELFVISRSGSASIAVSFTLTPNTTPWAVSVAGVGNAGTGVNNSQNTSLYNSIKSLIKSNVLTLGPSATMAGIYAAVDNDRGVWKAPANVGVTNIVGPSFLITESEQGGLNVDATSGKSINAIRTFTGRGTLVWGARTLEGNSNEWRYIPVRRLFIMAEESCKKASEFVVFEPNDKGTWLKVKGMITNFLTDLWKQGALAGATPEDAFFVRVGLGETMTAQDILEGKMIVSIGLAAVRPAEFIILDFMHMLQQS